MRAISNTVMLSMRDWRLELQGWADACFYLQPKSLSSQYKGWRERLEIGEREIKAVDIVSRRWWDVVRMTELQRRRRNSDLVDVCGHECQTPLTVRSLVYLRVTLLRVSPVGPFFIFKQLAQLRWGMTALRYAHLLILYDYAVKYLSGSAYMLYGAVLRGRADAQHRLTVY